MEKDKPGQTSLFFFSMCGKPVALLPGEMPVQQLGELYKRAPQKKIREEEE